MRTLPLNRRSQVLVAALFSTLVATASLTVGSSAAQAADESKMLRPGDMPYSSGGAEGPAHFIADVPAVAGLQLCDATLGARNVSISGPQTYSQVMIKAGAGGVVSEIAYEFPSTAAARKAWGQARKASRQCSGTFVGKQTGLGKVRTTLTTGDAEPAGGFWVNHSDAFSSAKTAGRAHDVRFSVFTLAGDAILVTSYTKLNTGTVQPGQQDAIIGLADSLTQRWNA